MILLAVLHQIKHEKRGRRIGPRIPKGDVEEELTLEKLITQSVKRVRLYLQLSDENKYSEAKVSKDNDEISAYTTLAMYLRQDLSLLVKIVFLVIPKFATSTSLQVAEVDLCHVLMHQRIVIPLASRDITRGLAIIIYNITT